MELQAILHRAFSTFFFAIIFIVIAFLLRSLFTVIYNLFFHPLRNVPGPKSWAASALQLAIVNLKGTEVYELLNLHKRYGPVVRIGPNDLSYADSVVHREALAHRKTGEADFPKSSTIAVTPLNGVKSIIFADRDAHARYRRAFASAFSERGLQQQKALVERYVNSLIDGLKSRCTEGPLDVTEWFNWASFDIIGALTYGESFECLENQRMHPWIRAIFSNIKGIAVISAMRQIGLSMLIPLLFSKKMMEGRIRHFEFSEQRTRNRVSMGTNQGDFLDAVLEKSDKEGGLTFDELVSNSSFLILAGSETTATLLSGAVYQLCSNPSTLKKAVAEVRSSFSSVSEIDQFSTAKLSYTLAVLDETMRIYPPVPNQTVRESPLNGAVIGDLAVPGGTNINISQYVMCHLDTLWAKPEEFHPERFLKDKSKVPAEFQNDDHSVFQPFSVGPRNCIGRNLAYAEMRLILTRVLFEFDLELDEASKGWTDGQKAFKLWEKPPLLVKMTPRF